MKKLATDRKMPEVKTHGLEEPTSELELYAQEVMNEMVRQNVPPTPSNFDTYFDKMLESKSPEFRKRILKILELEDTGEYEQQTLMEQHLKDAFNNIRKFMQLINLIYKNIRHLVNILEKRRFELKAATDKTSINSFINSIEKDIKTINKIIKKESSTIKERYEATSELVYEVQELAIYDSRFGVYKKRYFIKKVEQEVKLIKEFHHESSIMMVRISEDLLKKIDNQKIKHMILRTVARLLLKTSRRSDLVAVYDDEIFAILMRHTSVQNAKKAAERLKELVGNTNFFVGDSEINLDVDIGIARVDLERAIEVSLVCALDAISIGRKNGTSCGVCPQDEEAR